MLGFKYASCLFFRRDTAGEKSALPEVTYPGSCRARWTVVLSLKHSETQTYSLAPACSCLGMGSVLWDEVSPWSHPLSFHPVSRWVMEEWGACSRSCGKLGVQTRGTQCLLPLSNGTHKVMPAKACPGDRPEARRPCLRVPCPAQWRLGAWSQVIVLRRWEGLEEEVGLRDFLVFPAGKRVSA